MTKKAKVVRKKYASKKAKFGAIVRVPRLGPNEHIYSMVCAEGKYEANSWLGLGWAVFTHRLWHLWKHGRWAD